MLLSANDLRQTGENQFPVISGCKDTLPGSDYLSREQIKGGILGSLLT